MNAEKRIKLFEQAKALGANYLIVPQILPKGWKVVDYRLPKLGEEVVNVYGNIVTWSDMYYAQAMPIVEREVRKKIVFEPLLDENGEPVKSPLSSGDYFFNGNGIEQWTAPYASISTYPIYIKKEIEY